MNDFQKKEITGYLHAYIEQYPSQKKAVESLKNVSEATVINMRKDKWENISDEIWRTVGKQVGWSEGKPTGWQVVKTSNYKKLEYLFRDAQQYSYVYAITSPAGSGKTATIKNYCREHKNAYHISCAEYFNRKMFLSTILEKLGKDNTGYTVAEMMDCVVSTMLKLENPILFLDEGDKLSDQVLYFFITLFNRLEGKCALVLIATDFLEKRITRGVKLNKKGYSEIYSRLGRRFMSLGECSKADVISICKANGIEDMQAITQLYNEADGDLRRVERGVHKLLVQSSEFRVKSLASTGSATEQVKTMPKSVEEYMKENA